MCSPPKTLYIPEYDAQRERRRGCVTPKIPGRIRKTRTVSALFASGTATRLKLFGRTKLLTRRSNIRLQKRQYVCVFYAEKRS